MTRLSIRLALLALLGATTAPSAQTTAAPSPPFVPSGNVWGYVFADYFYKFRGDSAWGTSQYAKTPKDLHAGQLRRLYLGYDYRIAPKFTSRVLLEANNSTTFAGGSYGVLVKLGYIAWNRPAGLPLTVSAGLVPTPLFSFPERAWGYRSIEKEVLDARGIGSSADQGLLVEGTIGADGDYRLMVGNNSGTKPATERSKAVYSSISQRFLDKRLSLELMGTYLARSRGRDRSIGRVFVNYEGRHATFGLEVAGVYEASPAEFSSAAGTDVTRLLSSVFVAVPLRRAGVPVKLFARYDVYDPDLDFAADRAYTIPDPFYSEHLYTLGFDIAPHPRVHVMPNLWVNSYRERGGRPARSADVVPRITFYWTFG